jgi:hypothetical protein
VLAFEFGEVFESTVDWFSGEDECKWSGMICDSDMVMCTS